jgi:TRAP-type C4-dicarboxylate transport system substrate-binding protein
MKKLFLLAAIFFITVSWNIGAAPMSLGAEPTITLNWADYASPAYDQINYVKHYIKRIAEETKGRVQIKLYPNQQLVKALQQYEALMQGTIDMSNLTPTYYAGKMPLLTLSSETAYWKPGDSVVITSRTAKEIDEILARDGVKFMGWSTELPPMCTVGKKIYRTRADYKGMKVRAPGKAADVINRWGGVGVSIPASESYMALQTGVVDALYTTIGTTEGSRLWEVADSITFGLTGGSPQLICMNLKKWNSLPDDIKKSFEKVNREMVPWAWNHSLAYTKKTEELLKTKFKKWHLMTREEDEVLREATAGFIWQPVTKRFGAPAQKLWDKILAIAKECDEVRAKGKTPRFFED